jgi:hypothetical protein
MLFRSIPVIEVSLQAAALKLVDGGVADLQARAHQAGSSTAQDGASSAAAGIPGGPIGAAGKRSFIQRDRRTIAAFHSSQRRSCGPSRHPVHLR